MALQFALTQTTEKDILQAEEEENSDSLRITQYEYFVDIRLR